MRNTTVKNLLPEKITKEKLKQELEKKDSLLRKALTLFIKSEWAIPLDIITDIEKELGLNESVETNHQSHTAIISQRR